jgi:ABC transporter substrate binding protein
MLCRMLPAAADSIFWCLVPASGKKYCPHSTLQRQNGAQAVNLLAHRCCVEPRAFIECIVALRLPAVHQWPEIAEDGGLLGYGPRFTQVFRQRARMVAKILRGAKPTDIPIEQATHFELVVNLQTAQAIGHDVPPGLVLRADKVIE